MAEHQDPDTLSQAEPKRFTDGSPAKLRPKSPIQLSSSGLKGVHEFVNDFFGLVELLIIRLAGVLFLLYVLYEILKSKIEAG